MIADTIWDMILGKAGQLPGPVDPIFKEMAQAEGREFLQNDPQENYPDSLDDYRYKMSQKGWPLGEDDEELFEYAMHPSQYEAFKSGKAKDDFEQDLARRKEEKLMPKATQKPESIMVTVNGQSYKVNIAYDIQVKDPETVTSAAMGVMGGKELTAPLEGKFFLVNGAGETPKKVGDKVEVGDVVCYIEAMKTYNAIKTDVAGVITSIGFNPGDSVYEDDVLMTIG